MKEKKASLDLDKVQYCTTTVLRQASVAIATSISLVLIEAIWVIDKDTTHEDNVAKTCSFPYIALGNRCISCQRKQSYSTFVLQRFNGDEWESTKLVFPPDGRISFIISSPTSTSEGRTLSIESIDEFSLRAGTILWEHRISGAHFLLYSSHFCTFYSLKLIIPYNHFSFSMYIDSNLGTSRKGRAQIRRRAGTGWCGQSRKGWCLSKVVDSHLSNCFRDSTSEFYGEW